jgi:aryl-alcohol dehydrogenase-like predicted oxidoreductase
MRYRKFGRYDLKVSEIGFGAWAIGGPARLGEHVTGWGEVDDDVSLRTLEACLDLGINFIDTADAYGDGHSEELVGKAFSRRRDRVIICSKGGNRVTPEGRWTKDFSAEWIRQACEGSLRRLKTDYIDIYLFHTPRDHIELVPEEFAVLEGLKTEGKIRYYGISVATVEDGLKVLDCGCAEAIQVVYNVLEREAEDEFLPTAASQGVGIIDRVPLASGFLTGKYGADVAFGADDHRSQFSQEMIERYAHQAENLKELIADGSRTLAQLALQFCLTNPAVSVVIPGAKTPEQLRQNARASELGPLSEAELTRINQIVSFSGA